MTSWALQGTLGGSLEHEDGGCGQKREGKHGESEAYHWLLVSPTLALGQEQYQCQPG